MEDINIREVVKKLSARWYWFVISLGLALGLAFAYLAVTPKKYLVSTSIQVKDNSVGEKSSGTQEKFISGYEIPEKEAIVEDEIGILTTHSTIRQSVENLGFNVSYYELPSYLGGAGKYFGQQVYPAPFTVKPVSAEWQLTEVPVYIEFLENNKVHIKAESGKENSLHQYLSNKSVTEKKKLKLDTVITAGQPLATEWLNITVKQDSASPVKAGSSYFIGTYPDLYR
jgi:hypothetical protein